MSNLEQVKNHLKSLKGLDFKYLMKDLHNEEVITFEFSERDVNLKEKLSELFKNISFEDIGVFNYVKNNEWAKGSSHKAYLKVQ